MQTVKTSDPGIPFSHAYELESGLIVPALHPKDVAMEGGTIGEGGDLARLRESVASTVAPAHRPLLATASMHELMVMQHAYSGWAAAYYRAVSIAAMGASPVRPTPPARAATSVLAPESPALRPANRTATQTYDLKPGGRLPGLLGGAAWGSDPDARPLAFTPPIGQDVPASAMKLNGSSKGV